MNWDEADPDDDPDVSEARVRWLKAEYYFLRRQVALAKEQTRIAEPCWREATAAIDAIMRK